MDNNNSCCYGHGWTKIVSILALCAIIIVAILRDKIVNPNYRSITAMGQGRVSYVPDTATVNLGVQIDKAVKADEALNQLTARVAKVQAAIKTLGLAEEDMVTKNYSLLPQYDYKDGVSVVAGYSANQQLAVKIKDLPNNKNLLNKIVAEAAKAGANQVLGINFETADLDQLKQQARVAAITDARAKAGALAEAAGVELKEVNGWYENFLKGGSYGESGSSAAMGMGGGGGGVPQVTVGDNEILVEIGLTYSIKD